MSARRRGAAAAAPPPAATVQYRVARLSADGKLSLFRAVVARGLVDLRERAGCDVEFTALHAVSDDAPVGGEAGVACEGPNMLGNEGALLE